MTDLNKPKFKRKDLVRKHAELTSWSTVREIKCNDLVKAAQAVIDRWDSPNWRDGTHTADYIHSLRQAVDNTNVAKE